VAGEAEAEGVLNAEFTATTAADEVAWTPALSVTWSSKLQLPVAVDVVVAKL
jgi:hypothetical protein